MTLEKLKYFLLSFTPTVAQQDLIFFSILLRYMKLVPNYKKLNLRTDINNLISKFFHSNDGKTSASQSLLSMPCSSLSCSIESKVGEIQEINDFAYLETLIPWTAAITGKKKLGVMNEMNNLISFYAFQEEGEMDYSNDDGL